MSCLSFLSFIFLSLSSAWLTAASRLASLLVISDISAAKNDHKKLMKIETSRFTFLYLKRLMTWAQHFPCHKSLLSKLIQHRDPETARCWESSNKDLLKSLKKYKSSTFKVILLQLSLTNNPYPTTQNKRSVVECVEEKLNERINMSVIWLSGLACTSCHRPQMSQVTDTPISFYIYVHTGS